MAQLYMRDYHTGSPCTELFEAGTMLTDRRNDSFQSADSTSESLVP